MEKITITLDKMLDASSKAMQDMIMERPHVMLIAKELSEVCARTTHILFDENVKED